MELKASNPADTLPLDADIHPLIRVYFQFVHLKHLFRQGWLQHGIPRERCESVAEHSFGVALLSLMLADTCYPELNVEKVLRLALLHDFGEIYAGDLTPQHYVSAQEKAQRERQAVKLVFRNFPNSEEYLETWEDYENGSSPEARLVRQVDRLEMGLQAAVYEQEGFAGLEGFYASTLQALSDAEIVGIFKVLVQLVDNGKA